MGGLILVGHMNNPGLVTSTDIADARVYARQLRRQKVLGSLKRGLLLGSLFGAGSYFVSPLLHGSQLVSIPIAFVLFGLGALAGVLEAFHWLRHFVRLGRTIASVERRVSAGEAVLASEVKW